MTSNAFQMYTFAIKRVKEIDAINEVYIIL